MTVLQSFELRFSPEASLRWADKWWSVSVPVAALYVLAIFAGKSYMRDKPPYHLRQTLMVWNVCLAVFSGMGFYMFIPPLVASMREGGLAQSVCRTPLWTRPDLCLWLFLFSLSKMVELGDTAFVVLRKTPLNFLHWYHHVTVLLYCWAFYSSQTSIAHWFSCMNYGVHTLMYTYYALKGCGMNLPLWISKIITTLQMFQFFYGLGCTFYAHYLKANGFACDLDPTTFYISLVTYGSYAVLFANFFYQRYIKKPKKD